jgi:hypothetical protein
VYVLCGTRETKVSGVWKNSYHFIVANLYAAQCGDIKQLFQTETFRTGVNDDVLEWRPIAGGKPKPIIDPAVYTKFQNMRMPLCTKRSSDVPLRRINKEPFDPEDDLTAKFEDDDVSAILPALVSNIDKSKPTMKLLEPFTLVPQPLGPAVGTKRKFAPLSPTTSNPAAPLTYSPQRAREVADQLVSTHPDHIGGDYETWRNVVFAAINEAGAQTGAPSEFVKMLQEWTRIRESADHRTQEYPRIEAGTFASAGGRNGDSATVTMGSLVHNHKKYPAAFTSKRATNADPLPDCRALLDPEDVGFFELFEQFLRHVDYQQTSWKWAVQLASYVVPKLKDQVHDTIQGELGITTDEFDGVWDAEQPSDIYEFAFKRYLAAIVKDINSNLPPLVETTVGETEGEATADGISEPQEAVTTVGHVRTSMPKAQGRQPKRFTKEEVLTLIVRTSASVHSFESPETLRKAVRGALTGPKKVDKATEQLLDKNTEELMKLWALLQGKSSKKTGTALLQIKSSLDLYPSNSSVVIHGIKLNHQDPTELYPSNLTSRLK